MLPITQAQIDTITEEVLRFCEKRETPISPASIKLEVYPSCYDEEIGAYSYTMTHPGFKADRSDWSMSSSTLLQDGSHWDTDPVKPWELAD